jgi:hypothetical protein
MKFKPKVVENPNERISKIQTINKIEMDEIFHVSLLSTPM